MQLKFGKWQGDSIQGSIYIAFPDAKKSFVVGTFTAKESDASKMQRGK